MSQKDKLPEGWVFVKLGDIAFPAGKWNPKANDGDEFFYVDIEAVDNTTQKIVTPKQLPIAEAPSRARISIHSGDVIFSLVRPYLKNVAIVPTELDGQVASTAYCVVRPENGILSSYIFYAMLRNSFVSSIKTYGSSPPAAHDDEFFALSIPLAPTNEQRRIVAAIEQQFSRLDAAIEFLKRARTKLKHERTAVLKAAIEGKLTEEWRAEHPTTEPASTLLDSLLKERRAKWETDLRAIGKDPAKVKYVEPEKPDVDGLPELPEGWWWARVEQVGEVQLGRQRAPQYHTGPYMRPYLRVANVFEDRIDTSDILTMNFTPKEYEIYHLKFGDILLNEGQSLELIGRPAMYRDEVPGACFQNTLIRFRPYSGLLASYSLIVFRTYLHTKRFQRIGKHTTNIAHLGAGRFAGLEFPLPPRTEQEQIASEVEQALSVIAQLEAIVEANLKRSERLRQTILNEAFSGRLVAQDPEDEPASELLVQIREERAIREQEERQRRKVTVMSESPNEKLMVISSKERLSLHQVLVEAKKPLVPDDLFKRAGLQVDAVEEFFEELRKEIASKRIREIRPDDTQVYLEAVYK